ncbi:DUF4097 domain-containing protein [Alteribacter lacisalsi]|uniref:DUF4097 domain-containing protein n=1 Tax=Alteribacter lacisalsi TaxID=2045244 RepID=A0A2W0H473_9BACI|nr:DUF4097 domain-containing protein [Alteribacter lacisalsi]PYZ95821.1 DUF4097 domain-containing protein [Alteribacter lacisalsi]
MQEERKMILKMIEDGKISAEEGLQLLNALKEDKSQGDPGKTTQQETSHSTTSGSSHEISTKVDWENSSGEYRSRTKQPSFASRFTEFLEDAVHKIKEFDLDFNFGSSVEIEHTFQHTGAVVRHVDVNVENGSILLRPWDEPDVRVECNVKVYKVNDGDEARRFFLNEVIFDVTDGRLRIKSPSKSMKVNSVVYVPRKDLEKVKLYAFNGKITGETLEAVNVEAQTVNGRIGFDKVACRDARVETVNGTISVDDLSMDHCDAKTVNGTIDLRVSRGEVDVETLNGTINYTLTEPVDTKAYFKTTTGSVVAQLPENMKVEGNLKSSVGGLNCDLPGMTVIDEKKEFASKRMTFLANKEAEASFYLEAESGTGSVQVKNS